MATPYGTASSLAFKVKDTEAFKKAMDAIGIAVESEGEDVWMYSRDGFWPHEKEDFTPPANGEYVEMDLLAEIQPHLASDQAAVLLSCSTERQSVCWSGMAINDKNERHSVGELTFLEEVQKKMSAPNLAGQNF